MKKNDYICLFLSIVINIAILFVLAMFLTNEIVETDEIKIGLISTESDASTRFKGEKNVNAKKQNLDADSIEKKIEEDKTQEEKPENKPIEKSEKERPEKKVEESKNAEKTVQVDDKPKTTSKKEKPSLADLKKQISNSQPKTSNGSFSPTADSDGEEIVDRVLQSVTYSNGLVSGSKMGNSEGGLLVDWNDGNRIPEFPQSARASGKHGKLKIKLKVDKAGNILSYVIVEGSGVPEIDASVERVVGAWRVKLLKKGKPVNGTFYLNYNFNFK
ncbi:energy transducer TonB [Fusobacterium nucleatum]|uniref:energy transducer TonB n=1 Tax=Fusobacterium nucleatum TaxID=851 RepID=UPI0030D5E415